MSKFKLALFLFFIGAIIFSGYSYGSSIHKPIVNAKQNGALNTLKASEFVKLSAKQFSEITGKRLNLLDKASFALAKMQIRHDLKKHPNMQLMDYYAPKYKKSLVFKIVIGIVLFFCLFLLIIGLAGGGKG